MKLIYTTLLTVFTIFSTHAMAQDEQGLPNPGGNDPAPVEATPAQSTKEFNQDIDDFEKKVDKEVPGANKSKGDLDNGGKAKSAVPPHREKAIGASKKKSSATAKKKAAQKKTATKKKKKKSHP